ncbi:MAG: hypothetical protein JSU94_12690 [Phycisphaerales bacterium]|nr:MAG: hypothetical protein JSU94_12690 [Phycisphaerales bacterium]
MMEKNKGFVRVGFSTILWGVLTILLCAGPPAIALDVYGTLDIEGPIGESVHVYSGGTVNLLSGGSIADTLWAWSGSTVNIKAGTIGGLGVAVSTGATVTVTGTDFAVTNGIIDESGTKFTIIDIYSPAVLTGLYEGGVEAINLSFYSDPGVEIFLAAPTGQPGENTPPVADAGADLTVFTKDIASTVIAGSATDADEGDSLLYRWVEGEVEFTLWAPVGANGEAPLDLGTILPEFLGVGVHTLTLEVTDNKDTVSDEVVLTIEIAPVSIDIKPGSYPNTVNLGSFGVVPVAILSTAEFDATVLPPENVYLAGAGVAVRGKGNKCLATEEDVNGDGLIDLVVKVETENLDPGEFQDGWAVLRIYETSDQTSPVLYEGSDEITIVPPEG